MTSPGPGEICAATFWSFTTVRISMLLIRNSLHIGDINPFFGACHIAGNRPRKSEPIQKRGSYNYDSENEEPACTLALRGQSYQAWLHVRLANRE